MKRRFALLTVLVPAIAAVLCVLIGGRIVVYAGDCVRISSGETVPDYEKLTEKLGADKVYRYVLEYFPEYTLSSPDRRPGVEVFIKVVITQDKVAFECLPDRETAEKFFGVKLRDGKRKDGR